MIYFWVKILIQIKFVSNHIGIDTPSCKRMHDNALKVHGNGYSLLVNGDGGGRRPSMLESWWNMGITRRLM